MKKVKITEAPQNAKLKAGDWVTIEKAAELDVLTASGYKFITEAEDKILKARESVVDAAIKAAKAKKVFAPAEDTSEIRATALAMEATKDGLGVTWIASHEAPEPKGNLSRRVTAADAAGDDMTGRLSTGEIGLRETVRAFLQLHESDHKMLKNGGIIRACNNDAKGISEAVQNASIKAAITDKLVNLINAGADLRLTEDYVKAAYDGYADPAGALGVLNTALTLNQSMGHLENQLMILSDITTDLSGTPILYNQRARTRYTAVPGVQLKTATSSWSGGPGNDVDVDVLMGNYAGVPISVNNVLLGSTGRQLLNEQRAPQMYGLAEYILYTLIYTAFNGYTRFSNDGVTTTVVNAASAFADPTFGAGAFNVAGATLKTFVSDLPAAMDLSKFPGGDEEANAYDLMRWCWVHTSLYSAIAGDTAFQLNQSIQGIRQQPGENLIRTGRFTQVGNNKFRKSQLVTDNIATTGTGADGTTNAKFVVPGDYTAAKKVGLAGTRSSLLFVSRAPLDYTKVMPDVPSTAAIEMVASPKLGLPFVIVKYLDHAQEVANMRAQLMWGPAIGDERQLMALQQKA